MKTWRERIVEARERDGFTAEDRALAQSWATCAVGEQRAQYPSIVIYGRVNAEDEAWREGGPLDSSGLLNLGGDFYANVAFDRFNAAERLLDQIEDRVLQLKREARVP